MTRVTVRTAEEKHGRLLKQELEALSSLKHPNILLLMGLLKAGPSADTGR
jgi:hypothetical protein